MTSPGRQPAVVACADEDVAQTGFGEQVREVARVRGNGVAIVAHRAGLAEAAKVRREHQKPVRNEHRDRRLPDPPRLWPAVHEEHRRSGALDRERDGAEIGRGATMSFWSCQAHVATRNQ